MLSWIFKHSTTFLFYGFSVYLILAVEIRVPVYIYSASIHLIMTDIFVRPDGPAP